MLEIETNLSAAESDLLRARLDEHNLPFTGPRKTTDIGLVVRDQAGEVVAGLIGSCLWDWLHINVIWVAPELRGQRIGSRLLASAEQDAVAQERRLAMLHTFSFQARPFYEAHGYRAIFEFEDFPVGHSQFLMTKALV